MMLFYCCPEKIHSVFSASSQNRRRQYLFNLGLSLPEIKVEFCKVWPISCWPPLLGVQIFRDPDESLQTLTRIPSWWDVNFRLPNFWLFLITALSSVYSLRIGKSHNVTSRAECGTPFLLPPFSQGSCHSDPGCLGSSPLLLRAFLIVIWLYHQGYMREVDIMPKMTKYPEVSLFSG